jgi:arginyl-tRNA synthetase
MRFPEVIDSAAANRGPQIMANYLRETANAFHSFYENCDILSDDENIRHARLGLCKATAQVLSNGLALLGVSAPERM